MPELLDRDKAESAIALILARLFADERRKLEKLIGDPPNFSKIGASYWGDLQSSLADRLRPELLGVYEKASGQLLDDVGTAVTRDEVETDQAAGREWADRRATEAASSIVKNQRERIEKAASDHESALISIGVVLLGAGGLLLASGGQASSAQAKRAERVKRRTSERIFSAFSPSRAESIGITEVTTAATRGETDTVRRFERETGKKVAKVWNTERDARVCPICSPLDRRNLDEVPNEYSSGPPAHINCRCYLTFEVEDVLDRVNRLERNG